MHVFLTGSVQCGKSTALRKAVRLSGLAIGGFQTFFEGDRTKVKKTLHMADAAEMPLATSENLVVRFSEGMPQVRADRFDEIGCRLIGLARQNAALIIMDECGRLERDAIRFQQAVLAALDGDVPILGVVRQDADGWIETIKNHPRVKLLVVSVQNRESIPTMALEAIGQGFGLG